jgi:flagellar biosynthesis protein FlhB
LAFLYGVTIVEDRALARALYQRCALNSEVPEACYASVAAIYRAIRDKAAAQSKGVTDA